MLPRNSAAFLAVLLLSSVAIAASDAQKRHDLDVLLARARVANLRANGSPAFHLRLDIHAEHITRIRIDGTFDEVWMAPDAWRRETVFPEFKQVEVGDKDGRWVDRNLDFRPRTVYLVARLLDSLTLAEPMPEERVIKVHREKKDGMVLQCAELGAGPAHWTMCFDELGLLSSYEFQATRMEYHDYQKFGDAIFPHLLRVYENGERILEVSVAELGPPADSQTQIPHHSTAAMELAPCERWTPGIPVKRVAPEYPEEARRAHAQGTVVMYALLSADGAVQRVKVLQTAGPVLDEAALRAVRQWVYSPTDCGSGHPMPVEIEIWTNFTLSY